MKKIGKNSHFAMLPQKVINSLGNRILQVNEYGQIYMGDEMYYWCEVEKETGTKEYSLADIERICAGRGASLENIRQIGNDPITATVTFTQTATFLKFLSWLESEGEE